MKTLLFIIFIYLVPGSWAQANVEIQGQYLKDNKNFIYIKTENEKIKLKKSELTKEGVKQILANKDNKLIIFVPEKSIVRPQ